MGNEYFLIVTPGGMKLQRRWVQEPLPEWVTAQTGVMVPSSRVTATSVGRAGKPIEGFSPKARRHMRWVWNALPWDEVPNLAMLTLTYPGDWRRCCPDGKELKRHLKNFRERWRREWGGARGTWSLEFQPRLSRPVPQRLAPHFHLYVGIPEGATVEPDGTDGRLAWDWAREAWYEVVGSGNRAHRYWGVHVRPCFYGRYGGGATNGKRVGDYLWRESGKLAQKEAPEGFEGVKWWDVWGMSPREHEIQIGEGEFFQMRRPSVLLRDKVTGAKVRRPSGIDGLSVTNIDGIAIGTRLLPWAQEEADERRAAAEARSGASTDGQPSVEDG